MVPDALTEGPRFAAFCERYIRQTKGNRWGGRPLVLEDWQREFWWEALEVDPATGLRIYSQVGLGIPTKNGKSTQASAGGTYFLVADGEAEPEVYIAAAARNQAGIVLGQMRSMVLRSPLLLDKLTVQQYRILCRSNGGVARALASDGILQHGLNPSANIIDELHAHKDDTLFTALLKSTAARDQPFTLWISTAGVAGQGVLPAVHQTMFDGPGELEDRGFLKIYRDRANGILIWWYGADRDVDIEDPRVWRGVNPASWLQDGVWLGKQYAALRSRGALLEWRMYHLNQFAEHEEAWLLPGIWAGCLDTFVDELPEHPLQPDLPVGVAIDRAQSTDLAAVTVAQRQGEGCVVRSRVFSPDPVSGIVETAAVRAHLRELRERYPAPMANDPDTNRPAPGPAFAYDPTNFGESAEILEGEGLNMIRFAQTDQLMGPATALATDLLTEHRLIHDGDPQLAEHVGSSLAKVSERGTRITKLRRGSARKNPAAVAMVMAVAVAMAEPPAPRKPRAYAGAGW